MAYDPSAPTIEMVVRLQPEQVRKLIVVASLFNEPWDKTIQDAVDIAINRYDQLTEYARQKKAAEKLTQQKEPAADAPDRQET